MANESWVGHSANGNIGGGTFFFNFVGGANEGSSGEVFTQVPCPAGTFSKSSIYAATNAAATAATLRFRKNAANGNQVVTVGAGLTGWFQDTTNSDTVSNGDLCNWSLVSVNNIVWRGCMSMQFVPSSGNCVSWHGQGSDNSGNVGTGGNLFSWWSGIAATSDPVEVTTQMVVRAPGTASHLSMRPSSQAQLPTSWLRINGASGNLTIVENSASGLSTDTTHTDALANSDTLSFMTFRTPGNDRRWGLACFRFTSSGTTFDVQTGSKNGSIQSVSSVRYNGLFGTTTNANSTVEAEVQSKAPFQVKFSNLRVRCGAGNTAIANVTLAMRINGSTGTMAVTVPSGTSGYFEDTVNTDAANAGDLVNYRWNPVGTPTGGFQTLIAVTMDNTVTNPPRTGDADLEFGGFTIDAVAQKDAPDELGTAALEFGGFTQTVVGVRATTGGTRSFWTFGI